MCRALEAYPSPQKPHSAMRNNKGMPPCGICPRGEKTNNTPDPGCVHLHNRFGDPVRNSTSIWRVHPANTAPILRESVVFRGKEMPTFGIFGCGTHVQREWALQCVHCRKSVQGVAQSVLRLEKCTFIKTVPVSFPDHGEGIGRLVFVLP